MSFIKAYWFPLLLGLVLVLVVVSEMLFNGARAKKNGSSQTQHSSAEEWHAPDLSSLGDNEEGKMIRYGRELIANTSSFYGPRGKIAAITNGLNCQNCHLEAGTRSFAGCFSAVASTYPRYRERSGRLESIEFRINDCLLRSLDGKKIDSSGKEMQAMVAYLRWVGKDVSKNKKPAGSGLEELPFLDRAADPVKGKNIFIAKCVSCHGASGQGVFNRDSSFYVYPPLWGANSFNVSAGMYRITRLAAFVKNSMPYGPASHTVPQLTNEEAWDVSAFVLSQPRPEILFREDWPKLDTKPIDYPFGPYPDRFSELQHKYGPFPEILADRKNTKTK